MEEDTAKLTHGYLETKNTNHNSAHKAKVSFIDYNRSGVPLVEIVTEPDFTDAKEVVEYLQKLRLIVRYLEVANADMEKGEMRLEPNISLKKIDQNTLPSYKVEVKNINSFRFVEKAINYEISRQREILEKGNTPQQETRGWDEDKGLTFSQRVKEEANDYRYFPEPDIPPVRYSLDQISNLKSQVPELQEEKIVRFVKQFAIPYYDAEILTREKALADYFEEAVKIGYPKGITPKQIGNAIINKKIDYLKIAPEKLITEIEKITKIESVSDEQLQSVIEKVLLENPKAVQDYKSGKESVIMFLIGMTMRAIKRKIDAQIVRKKLEETLKK
jgi:aspartyl-tRNA(Asn)/glutamyl-tRNA(Gln) amidotransferase subunit B